MRLTQLLGIELPIIQAPMAGVQGSALTIAVSNAGGLGSLVRCSIPNKLAVSWKPSEPNWTVHSASIFLP